MARGSPSSRTQNLGDGRRGVRRQRERRDPGPASGDEHRDGVDGLELVRRGQRTEVGDRQLGDLHLVLAGDAQGDAAGGEHGERRARAEQGCDVGSGVDDLLEVVEHQEPRPFAEALGDRLQRRRAGVERERRASTPPTAAAGRVSRWTPARRRRRRRGRPRPPARRPRRPGRVLPTPPGPRSVSNRISGRRRSRATASSSCTRPMSGDVGWGRLTVGRPSEAGSGRAPAPRSGSCSRMRLSSSRSAGPGSIPSSSTRVSRARP